jgi:hypothetical protein
MERVLAKYKMLAFGNSVEGQEAAYNCHYRNRHIPDLLTLPGVRSAQRYELVDSPKFGYLTVLDLEVDSLAEFQATLTEAFSSGRLASSPSVSPDWEVVYAKAVD